MALLIITSFGRGLPSPSPGPRVSEVPTLETGIFFFGFRSSELRGDEVSRLTEGHTRPVGSRADDDFLHFGRGGRWGKVFPPPPPGQPHVVISARVLKIIYLIFFCFAFFYPWLGGG